MNRPDSALVCARSWLASRAAALIIGLVVIWVAASPRAAWGQWTTGSGGTIYYNGGNVGIGTASPGSKLQVVGDTLQDGVLYVRNPSSPSALGRLLHSGVPGGNFHLDTFYGSMYLNYYSGTAVYIGNGAGGLVSTFLANGNVGIGTINPQYTLSVNGTIGTKDVIVTSTGWSDYVFRPGYRLRPLSEVSAYVQKHHHLPDIPTEAEIKEKGVSMAGMQAKLLAKVEELTLHLIQQEKENKELRERLGQLENRVAASSLDGSRR